MRILVVHNRYRSTAPSGENRVVDQEVSALLADGHDVERFERLSDDIESWPLLQRAILPAKVVHNGETRGALVRTIRQFHPDVVHVHNTFPVVSPSVLGACLDERVPVVATIHNYKLLCASGDLFRDGQVCHDCVGRNVATPALRHRCYRGSLAATIPVVLGLSVNRRAWRDDVSAFIFISEAQRRLCASLGLPESRSFVKDNLVPSQLDGRPTGREHLVAYLGRLDEAKGIPLLLRAWELFTAQGSDGGLRLVIAGNGPLDELVRTWAADRPEVEVVGLLSAADCTALLGRARAAVLPSQWEETFGLVAVEAMASATPSLAAGHGSFSDLITHGVDGVLFTPGDATSLADVLRDVDTRPEHFAALGRTARRTYVERFDPATNLRALLKLYRFAVTYPVWAGSAPFSTLA